MTTSSDPVDLVFFSPVHSQAEKRGAGGVTLQFVFLASGNVSGSDFQQPHVVY